MIRLVAALLWLAAVTDTISAQSETSAPSVGAFGLHVPDGPTIGASSGNEILRHRSPTGSPCLAVSGFARAHATNRNVYDHVITAKNSCAQRITLQVCYYRSQDCLPMEVPGGERKEAVLGTLPAAADFRFEFREKF
jgi:hypothetical protein